MTDHAELRRLADAVVINKGEARARAWTKFHTELAVADVLALLDAAERADRAIELLRRVCVEDSVELDRVIDAFLTEVDHE